MGAQSHVRSRRATSDCSRLVPGKIDAELMAVIGDEVM